MKLSPSPEKQHDIILISASLILNYLSELFKKIKLYLMRFRTMKKKASIFLFIILSTSSVFSQTGGDNIYEFLNLTHSGLVSSLGGTNVSLQTGYHNPSLLSADMSKSLALNYVNYFAGINYGLAMYSRSVKGIGNFAAGLTYLNYGSFTETDQSGIITGSFNAAEYSLSLIYSRQIDSLLTVGATLKPILSQLERYRSFGFAIDFGASWHNHNHLFSAGLVVKNIGYEVTTYAGEERQKLPFEIQAGLTQRLPHAPFRFSLTLRHLEKFDLTYQYKTSSGTENTKVSSGFLENTMRHVIAGIELIPSKNFYLSAGYNYQRRRELEIETKTSTVGFSWGFGINTSILNIEFGRATYHLAGSSTNVSLVLRPDLFYKRNR
jgi:hypothetical protein